jgi:hypothetical protein
MQRSLQREMLIFTCSHSQAGCKELHHTQEQAILIYRGSWIEDVVVAWPIQEMDSWVAPLWEVMCDHFRCFSSIHVPNANSNVQSCAQGYDMDMITLFIHWLYLLEIRNTKMKGLRWIVDGCSVCQETYCYGT